MIVSMRLGVASQGAAVAQAAAAVAERYAAERGQGGDPAAPPVPITAHAEVRRLLLAMRARAEAARLIALQAAAWVDAGDAGDAAAAARAAMLLPVAKSFGAEAAFANADAAIQVLGGAGYVTRLAGGADAPRLPGVLDLRGHHRDPGPRPAAAPRARRRRRRRAARPAGSLWRPVPNWRTRWGAPPLRLRKRRGRMREAAAAPFLRLLGLACADGLLRRAGRQAGPLAGRYAALAEHHAAEAGTRAAALSARCLRGGLDAAFDAVFPP